MRSLVTVSSAVEIKSQHECTHSMRFISPPATGERIIVMPVSVREHISGNTRLIFSNFLSMLPMAVARSCSGGAAIRYVHPVYG